MLSDQRSSVAASDVRARHSAVFTAHAGGSKPITATAPGLTEAPDAIMWNGVARKAQTRWGRIPALCD